MNCKVIRQIWENLSQQELSDLFGIPKRTIERWDGRETLSPYVFDMLYNILARIHAYFISHCVEQGIIPTKDKFMQYFREHYTFVSEQFLESSSGSGTE